MKQTWQTLSFKIDALSLRERALTFAAFAALLIFLFYSLVLNPLYAKQTASLARMSQQQNQIAGINLEMTQKMQAYAIDPDALSKLSLQKIKLETEQLGSALRITQKGLVAPDKIVFLLENILKSHGKLHLVSLKTLPASGVSDAALLNAEHGADAKAQALVPSTATAPVKPPELLYRHGVEIVVQGSYPDMERYMAALETMPAQLFWGRAKLSVIEYPIAKLTLTLYTVSLDNKWMKL